MTSGLRTRRSVRRCPPRDTIRRAAFLAIGPRSTSCPRTCQPVPDPTYCILEGATGEARRGVALDHHRPPVTLRQPLSVDGVPGYLEPQRGLSEQRGDLVECHLERLRCRNSPGWADHVALAGTAWPRDILVRKHADTKGVPAHSCHTGKLSWFGGREADDASRYHVRRGKRGGGGARLSGSSRQGVGTSDAVRPAVPATDDRR